jgi:hypothetical protein
MQFEPEGLDRTTGKCRPWNHKQLKDWPYQHDPTKKVRAVKFLASVIKFLKFLASVISFSRCHLGNQIRQ